MSHKERHKDVSIRQLRADFQRLDDGLTLSTGCDLMADIPVDEVVDVVDDILPLAQRMEAAKQWEDLPSLPDFLWHDDAEEVSFSPSAELTGVQVLLAEPEAPERMALDAPDEAVVSVASGVSSWSGWLSLGAVAFAALMFAIVPPPSQQVMQGANDPVVPGHLLVPPVVRAKGAGAVVAPDVRVRLFLRRGQQFVKEASVMPIVPGDQVRFGYWLKTPEAVYLSLFSVDAKGRLTMLYPTHPTKPLSLMPLPKSERQRRRMLPGGVLLDASSVGSRLYVCVSLQPIARTAIRSVIRVSGASQVMLRPTLPLSCSYQKSWLLTADKAR